MKNLLALLLLTFAFQASANDPGAIGAGDANAQRCFTDPTSGSGYKCYNPDWITLPKLRQHIDYALTLGNHNGATGTKIFSGAGNTDYHCSEDVLYNSVQAANRSLWSLKCKYIDAQRIGAMLFQADFITGNLQVKPIVHYPIYGTKSGSTLNVYKLADKNMDYRTRACNLPAGLKYLQPCEAGCFAQDTSFAYAIQDIDVVTTLANAPLDEKIEVHALSSDSNLDHLNYTKVPAWTLKTSGEQFSGEEVFSIYVENETKASLRVSGNHPLINAQGEIVIPADLTVGQELMTSTGPKTVTKISVAQEDTKMFNILPDSKDLKNNILVTSNGFLVGSQRIQRKEYGNMLRALFRDNIEIDY